MRIFSFARQDGHHVDKFASSFILSPLTDPGGRARVACFHLGPGEIVGEHEAVVGQLFWLSGYRTVLYKVADEHHCYVTTALAQAAGVPSVEVRKLASRGGMTISPAACIASTGSTAATTPRTRRRSCESATRRDLPAYIRLVHSRTDPADLTSDDGVASITVETAIRDSIGSVMADRLADATRRAADEGLVRRAAADTLLQEISSPA